MLSEARQYAEAVKPLGRSIETRQEFAAALHDAARPLVRVARPRNEFDVQKLDAVMISALAGEGIDPVSKLGLFARERVREIAVLPWQLAFFASPTEGEPASPPTIRDFAQQYFTDSGASVHDLDTSGVDWASGDFVFAAVGTSATIGLTSIAGTTNDTYSGSADALVTGARAFMREGAIVTAMDGTTRLTLSGSRRAGFGVVTVQGASGIDDSGAALATATGTGSSADSPSFDTVTANCLVFSIITVRARHTGLTVPDGYTLLGTLLDPGAGGTANNTFAIAYKTQASAGTVAAATWTGFAASEAWASIHFAVAP